MAEDELVLAGQRRLPYAPHQVLGDQRAQGAVHLCGPAPPEGGQGAVPEDVTEHGGVAQCGLLGGRQRVETGRHHGLDRGRQQCALHLV
jgi:hypothetical protein